MDALREDPLDVVPEPGPMARLLQIERGRQFDRHPASVALEVDRHRRSDKSCFRRHKGGFSHAKSVAFEHATKVAFVDEVGHADQNEVWWPTEQPVIQAYSSLRHRPRAHRPRPVPTYPA